MKEIKLALAHIEKRQCVKMDDFKQIIDHLPVEMRNDFLEILTKLLGQKALYLEYPHQIYGVCNSLIENRAFPCQQFIESMNDFLMNLN